MWWLELKALKREAKSLGVAPQNYSDNFSKSMSNLGESSKRQPLPVLASLGTVAEARWPVSRQEWARSAP